jgi:chromate transport protein ChrA
LEKLIEHKGLHTFLDGLMASVVGLIAATAFALFRTALSDLFALVLFGLALVALYRWQSKASVAVVMLASGLIGILVTIMLKM